MAFGRFLDGDVYVFEHVGGYIQCCGCSIIDSELTVDDEHWSFNAKTPRQMLKHLEKHKNLGHDVVVAKARIEEEYDDIDKPIERSLFG